MEPTTGLEPVTSPYKEVLYQLSYVGTGNQLLQLPPLARGLAVIADPDCSYGARGGVEPPRRLHTALNRTRLPIPPPERKFHARTFAKGRYLRPSC